jgi:GDP-4-dehydro-6-deoxy-D-mannose reductase
VTGAAGFAGGHLLDLLAGHGCPVVAWHRPGGTPPPGPAIHGGSADARPATLVRWEAVDLLDREGVRESLRRIRPQAVYHCAGAARTWPSWTTVESTFAANVRGTHHLIEGLRDIGLNARVLLPGSATVYAPSDGPIREDHELAPSNPYGLSKLAQEMVGYWNPGGPEVVIARPFNHFGPRQDAGFVAADFARRIADIEAGRWKPVLDVGNVNVKRDLTDVRDTVRAYKVILERGTPGRPYNVCRGTAIAVRDLLEMMLARARVRIEVTVDPTRVRPSDHPIVVGDPSRLRDELGWTPSIPIEQTVDDLLAFWRSR